MDDILREGGVGKGDLGYYFKSKECFDQYEESFGGRLAMKTAKAVGATRALTEVRLKSDEGARGERPATCRGGRARAGRWLAVIYGALTALLLPAPASADDSELAKQLSNPVASLVSVPFQFNWDTGIGPKDADRVTLNVQPVVPFSLNDDWNLISRTILPISYLGSTADGVDSAFGLGDVVQSLFFSPVKPVGGWILGGGPVLLLPTATADAFKSRQFGLGPTAVALRQHGGWTYGALVNHIWGVNDPSDREQVNNTFLQPFLAYTTPTAVTVSLNTETTYDWSSRQWTVPINAAVSKLVSIGSQKVSFQFGGRYYLEAPEGGPTWGLRFSVTLLFPK